MLLSGWQRLAPAFTGGVRCCAVASGGIPAAAPAAGPSPRLSDRGLLPPFSGWLCWFHSAAFGNLEGVWPPRCRKACWCSWPRRIICPACSRLVPEGVGPACRTPAEQNWRGGFARWAMWGHRKFCSLPHHQYGADACRIVHSWGPQVVTPPPCAYPVLPVGCVYRYVQKRDKWECMDNCCAWSPQFRAGA